MSRSNSPKRRHSKKIGRKQNAFNVCPVTRKIKFPTKKMALGELNRIRKIKVAAGQEAPVRVYKCREKGCCSYHLTKSIPWSEHG